MRTKASKIRLYFMPTKPRRPIAPLELLKGGRVRSRNCITSTGSPVVLNDGRERRTLAERVAAVGGVEVAGVFVRHAAPNREAFTGGYLGRWGELSPMIYRRRISRELRSKVRDTGTPVDDTGVPAHFGEAASFVSRASGG